MSFTWALPQYRAELVVAPATAEFYGMNSAGTIVGWMDTPTNNKGLIRRANGEIVVVEPPPGYEGYEVDFTDINDAGQISGTLVHGFNGTGKGFVYTEAGGFRIMNSAPTEAIATSSMTNDGLMAFTYSGGSGLWNPETNAFTPIPQFGLSAALSGHRATGRNWSWHNGSFTQLQGTGLIFAQSINSSGLVAGYKLMGARRVASIWEANGFEEFTDENPSYKSAFYSINSSEIAVGNRELGAGEFYGTIYSRETGTVNINSLVVESNFMGVIGSVNRIMDNHKAMGAAMINGQRKTILLTPVPEPGTMLALGAGLAALLRRRLTT